MDLAHQLSRLHKAMTFCVLMARTCVVTELVRVICLLLHEGRHKHAVIMFTSYCRYVITDYQIGIAMSQLIY